MENVESEIVNVDALVDWKALLYVFSVTVIDVATASELFKEMIEPPPLGLFFVNVNSDKVSNLPELTLNMFQLLSPEIVTDSDPDGPVMVKLSVIWGKSEVRVIVPLNPSSNPIVSIADEPFAAMIPDLKDPEVPSSASVDTKNSPA
ncbi:hypothetical protein N9086_06350 [Akkermansiaceae bacterium]|nr:hypothetical protein [Akkermansiaceae bacterium]